MLSKLLDNKKKMLYALAILAAAVLLAAGMMAAASFRDDHVSAETENVSEEEQTGDAVEVTEVNVDTSDAHAAEVFACKVEDVKDSAAVATLLETMGLSDVTGKYAVHIAEKDGAQTLTLTVELPVKESDAAAFNANMEKYAQQMLALIPQIDKVEWIYSVTSSGGEEQAVGSLDEAKAAETLGNEPDSYGKSENSFKKLLTMQVEASQKN